MIDAYDDEHTYAYDKDAQAWCRCDGWRPSGIASDEALLFRDGVQVAGVFGLDGKTRATIKSPHELTITFWNNETVAEAKAIVEKIVEALQPIVCDKTGADTTAAKQAQSWFQETLKRDRAEVLAELEAKGLGNSRLAQWVRGDLFDITSKKLVYVLTPTMSPFDLADILIRIFDETWDKALLDDGGIIRDHVCGHEYGPYMIAGKTYRHLDTSAYDQIPDATWGDAWEIWRLAMKETEEKL